MKNLTTLFILAFMMLVSTSTLSAQTDIYWVGGSGDWNDPGMWYKDQLGVNPADVVPDENNNAHFTKDSGLDGKIVTIPTGSYDIHSILVTTNDPFTFALDGTSFNEVDVNIYGNLTLTSSVSLTYASTFANHNSWNFIEATDHNVTTGGNDLQSVEIHGVGVEFRQLDALQASTQIRMFGGRWKTNGHDVNAGLIWFRDNEGSSNPMTKIFETQGSNIYCDEWDSRLTYGSLTVSGQHQIFAEVFTGSPQQLNGSPFLFDEIHLLEYTDSQAPLVANYNFECTNCIVNDLIIEDTGITKLAGKFTLNGTLEVVNMESIIQFSSGNGREEEVIIEGEIKTPKITGCEKRTIFENKHSDFITVIRNSGTLTINDAIVNNMKAVGNASFEVSNGIIQGSSTGWQSVNSPDPVDYVWNGPSGAVGDWDEPNNWAVVGEGSNGCIPSLIDNVFVDESSKGDIRIPSNYTAECNNFIWTNKENLELTLDGTNILQSKLMVVGHFDLNSSTIITGDERHEIQFSSGTDNYIMTRGVTLPDIRFIGELASWTLEDDLACDLLVFEGGTLNTNNHSITTDTWSSVESSPKQFNFGSSTITVNGEMALSRTEDHNVTVNHGTSLIICEDLICFVHDLYDVQFNNSNSLSLDNYSYNFNKIILNGTGVVSTNNDLTLNELQFTADGSSFAVDPLDYFTITGGIESMTSIANPGVLKSKTSGVRAIFTKPSGNLCISGQVAIQDMEANAEGVVHAPEGVDDGNNLGISFIPFPSSQSVPLYWVGNTNTNWAIRSNWSSVSGGCSTNFNPNNRPRLIFNEHSYYENDEVTIFASTVTNEIEFDNVTQEFVFDNRVNLTLDEIIMSNSWVQFIGNDYTMNGSVTVSNGTFIEVLARTMTAGAWNFTNSGTNSLMIIRDGSDVEQVEN